MKREMLVITTCLVLVTSIFAGKESGAGQEPVTPAGQEELGIGEPISNSLLGSYSGGQDVTIGDMNVLLNDMKQNAQIDQNVLHSSNTGSNMVSSEAFTGATGITTLIQNSGNQVVINNALILNLLLK